MTDIVYTNKSGVIRRFSLIGNGLEGNQGTFCPRFIGYCVWKTFRQFHTGLHLIRVVSFAKRFTTLYTELSMGLIGSSIIDRAIDN